MIPNKDRSSAKPDGNRLELTPEMVQKVADKVYALWLHDSQIERERKRPFPRRRKGKL